MENKKQNKILFQRGTVKILMEEFGLTRPTVARALKGDVTKVVHQQLRARALELGGVEQQPRN